MKPLKMDSPQKKAVNSKFATKKLFEHIGAYKVQIVFAIIFAIVSTILAIVGPKILGEITTEIFNGLLGKVNGSTTGIDFAKITSIIITLLLLYGLSMLLSVIQASMMTSVSTKLTKKLRTDVNEKINNLPLSFFDRVSNGDVLSYLTNDIETINQSLNTAIIQFITSITSIIGIIVMMLTISVSMTAVAVLVLPISIIVVGIIMKKTQKLFKQQQSLLAETNAQVEEMFGCHEIVSTFNCEEKAINNFEEASKKLSQCAQKANFRSGVIMPIMSFVGNIGYVAICLMGGYMSITNPNFGIGNIQSFIQYMRLFNQPIGQLSQITNIFQQTLAASERVFTFLDEKEEMQDDACVAKISCATKIKGDVEFKNVCFSYEEGKPIINDFSCKVKSGQTVAIVGPTGAGKTTIVKLLMRFYGISSGDILVDGKSIYDYAKKEIRGAMGMVLQDAWLFSGTVAENITFGNDHSTKEKMLEAADAAQVSHFVKTLPNGFENILNEETSNISQGQKQLITIARTFLADPEILILDEATSSVDTRTEEMIQDAMHNLMKGRTCFVIAHRLSTIKNADLILVMKNGDIIEQGSHDELLAKKGFYSNLYQAQFEN